MENSGGPDGDVDNLWGMTFHPVPDELKLRPLTDQILIRDILDLCVDERTRDRGGLCLLLCDAQYRLVEPVRYDEVPDDCTEEDIDRILGRFVPLLREIVPDVTLMLAVARPGAPVPDDLDLAWRAVAERVCAQTGIELLDVWLVTPGGSCPVEAEAAVT